MTTRVYNSALLSAGAGPGTTPSAGGLTQALIPLFDLQVRQQQGPRPDFVSAFEPVLRVERCRALAAAALAAGPHGPPRPHSALPLALWVSLLSSRPPPLGDGRPRLATAGHWPFGPASHVEFGSGARERRGRCPGGRIPSDPLPRQVLARGFFPRSRLERLTLGLLLCSATGRARRPQRAGGSAINQPLFCPLLCRTSVHELSVSASTPVPPLGGAGP